MEIWGTGPFDNSQAMALCDALAAGEEPAARLREALARVAHNPEPPGEGPGAQAVAAAHLVALDLGYGESNPPGEVRPRLWALTPAQAKALKQLASQALQRVLGEGSRLALHWQAQGPEGESWRAAVEKLALHLEAPADTPPPPRPFWERTP
jgi:hypothetical protein